jgi:hypothetical protein
MEISKIAFSAITGIGVTNLILTPLEFNLKLLKTKSSQQVFDYYTRNSAKTLAKAHFKKLGHNLKEITSKELIFVIVTECFKLKLGLTNPLI